MVDLTLYNARATAYHEQTKDYELISMKEQIKYEFKSNPSYFQINYNGTNRDIHLVDNNKSFTKKVGEKKLLGYPDDVYAQGEYFTLFNKNWIILSKDEESQIQEKCYVSVCNGNIALNSNGLIFEYDSGYNYDSLMPYAEDSIGYLIYPCLIESSSFSIGLDENNPFDVGNDIIKITLKKDNLTTNIAENQRFIFGNKRAYKITKINDYISNLVVLTLQRDAFNPSTDKQVTFDSKQYWIANYSAEPTPQPTSTEIIITPNTDIVKKSQTSGVNFTAKLYINGVETADTFTFTIENTSTAIPSEYAFTVVSGNEFNVKSLTMNKYVNIKAISTLSPTTHIVKKINLTLY